MPWGEVIVGVTSGLLGAVIGWYGHRVARRNALDTNRTTLIGLQKQDIRWALDQIATGDPVKIELAVDRLSALRDAVPLEPDDALTVERALWRALQPRLGLLPSPPPVQRPGLLRRWLRGSVEPQQRDGEGR